MKASVDFEDLIGVLVDRYIQPLILKVESMSQQVNDLQAAVTALTSIVAATVSNETALKQKLDAAIAANASLTAQLASAQSGQADPADAAAIAAATGAIQAQNQALSDAATQTSPSN